MSDSPDRRDCSPQGSSVHGIFQTRILECAVISFSRDSWQSRDQTRISCTAGEFFIPLSHQGSNSNNCCSNVNLHQPTPSSSCSYFASVFLVHTLTYICAHEWGSVYGPSQTKSSVTVRTLGLLFSTQLSALEKGGKRRQRKKTAVTRGVHQMVL